MYNTSVMTTPTDDILDLFIEYDVDPKKATTLFRLLKTKVKIKNYLKNDKEMDEVLKKGGVWGHDPQELKKRFRTAKALTAYFESQQRIEDMFDEIDADEKTRKYYRKTYVTEGLIKKAIEKDSL